MICSFCTVNKFLSNCQLKWELLKYEVWKFTINYTKQIAKEKWQQRTIPENQLKIFEKNLDEDDNLSSIITLKMNYMQFTTTSQKGYVLEANATGINTAKNQQFFFLI